MSKILVINSSVRVADSHSRQLAARLVDQLQAKDQHITVSYRDLASQPLPHFDADAFEGLQGSGGTEGGRAAQTLSDTLIEELQSHDTIIIGAPMYNFTIPSTLKAWFDYIARAGVTFKYSEKGPEGLLKNKKVYVINPRGGVPSGAPIDHLEPYLKTMLGFVGLTDVTFLAAAGVDMANGQEALEAIHAEIAAL